MIEIAPFEYFASLVRENPEAVAWYAMAICFIGVAGIAVELIKQGRRGWK